MTAISYLGITNGTTTAGPFNVTSLGSVATRMMFFVYHSQASNSGVQLTDVRYDSAGANTALTLVNRWEYSNGATINEVIEVWKLPEASIQSGAKSFSWTKNGVVVSAARQSVVQFDGIDQTTPTNGTSSANIVATTTGSTTVEVNTDGGALAFVTNDTSTITHDWTTNAYTEIADTAMATNGSRSIAYKIASGTQTPFDTLSASTSGIIAAIALNANGITTSIDLTSINGGSAIKEGDTGVPLVGTGMNATGAGMRLRIVSAPTTFQAASAYSASSATNATATVPTLTSLPFTTTSWAIEGLGTSTGGNDGSSVSTTLNPAAGYSVVQIGSTPDLSPASLLSYLGWTAIATDQIHWVNAVTALGTPVTITVNDDGTVSLDSGGSPMPSAVTFDWRAWSSADKLWTSFTTATFGTSSASTASGARANVRLLDLMRRKRH